MVALVQRFIATSIATFFTTLSSSMFMSYSCDHDLALGVQALKLSLKGDKPAVRGGSEVNHDLDGTLGLIKLACKQSEVFIKDLIDTGKVLPDIVRQCCQEDLPNILRRARNNLGKSVIKCIDPEYHREMVFQEQFPDFEYEGEHEVEDDEDDK